MIVFVRIDPYLVGHTNLAINSLSSLWCKLVSWWPCPLVITARWFKISAFGIRALSFPDWTPSYCIRQCFLAVLIVKLWALINWPTTSRPHPVLLVNRYQLWELAKLKGAVVRVFVDFLRKVWHHTKYIAMALFSVRVLSDACTATTLCIVLWNTRTGFRRYVAYLMPKLFINSTLKCHTIRIGPPSSLTPSLFMPSIDSFSLRKSWPFQDILLSLNMQLHSLVVIVQIIVVRKYWPLYRILMSNKI